MGAVGTIKTDEEASVSTYNRTSSIKLSVYDNLIYMDLVINYNLPTVLVKGWDWVD